MFPVVAKDLTIQIYDAWKSGTFGSSLLKLSILGEFNFKQVASLKEKLLEKVPALKSMTERKFSPKGVVFEVDAGGSAEELVKILKGLRFEGFALSVKTWSSDNVSIRASFT